MQEPVQIVRRIEDLCAFLAGWDRGIPLGFDTETSGPTITWSGKKRPDPYRARLTGCSFALGASNIYVPVSHKEDAPGVAASNIDADALREELTHTFRRVEAEDMTLVAHNWVFDLQVCNNFGVPIPVFSDRLYDSMVAAWLAGWGTQKQLKLKPLAERLGLGAGDTFDEVARGRQTEDIPVMEIAPYAGRDAWLAVQVLTRAWAVLEKNDLVKHFREIDMPQIEILRGAQEAGNAVDFDELRSLGAQLEVEAAALAEEFRAKTEWIVEMPVNHRVPTPALYKNGNPKLVTMEFQEPQLLGARVGNDRDVSRWCYEELQCWPLPPGAKKNGADHYDTDKETVEPFCALPGLGGELARIRLEYGKRTKLLSTYVAPMLGLPPQYGDNRLHTSYNLTGTVTQRLSSSGPNLQNLPSRSPEGKRVRKALIADPGWTILVYDYSQIELRICAHLSRDEEMIACYVLGEDIHQGTLDAMLQLWSGAVRTDAKITNFSTIYNISAASLAVKMRTTEDRAEASIEAFFRRFKRIRTYHTGAVAYAKEHGHARTIDGFKRPLDVTPKWNFRTKKMEVAWSVQNEAINTPIQGSAGGLIKIAMRGAHRTWVAAGVYGEKVRFVGQEHDSAIVTAREDYAEQAGREMKHAMEHAWALRVPLICEGGSGPNWCDAKG